VVVKAFHAVKLLRPDINLLMVIAVAGAIGLGEWFEAATVAFLFALSLVLESWSVGRARRAELLPDDKVAAVEDLVAAHGTVAMVGDGVNDAPAMARASFGIAMGAMGSDAAIETADIALMTDDLTRLPWLVWHSRRTLAVIQQNIAFSIAIKALFVGLTFAGAATLWGAIAADVGATLLVVFNALRLLRTTGSGVPAARMAGDKAPAPVAT